MLEDLDTINWDGLGGAYGPAGDAAEILRGLASPDEGIAGEALDDFFSSIWHQGTVYPVTAVAVPFIVGLAAGRAVHHRDGCPVLRVGRVRRSEHERRQRPTRGP